MRRRLPELSIAGRLIGADHPPLVVAEAGINHEGDIHKAIQMIDDAAAAGCECVKFQSHCPAEEMIPNDVVPGNARESIWDIIERCTLTFEQEQQLMDHASSKGLIFLSTPFSREAADRLHRLGTSAFKIGSGECNNYPFIKHVAAYGKPVILSTGMNGLSAISRAVDILRTAHVPFALLHCTSLYPTPYSEVRLGALGQIRAAFPDAVLGLSDHTPTIYPALASVALGVSIIERHFTSDKTWPGPDIAISMSPIELAQLVEGTLAVYQALGGEKEILPAESPTIRFAYASVVSLMPLEPGQRLDMSNIWVKRPGTGEILARDFEQLIGRIVGQPVPAHTQLRWADLEA